MVFGFIFIIAQYCAIHEHTNERTVCTHCTVVWCTCTCTCKCCDKFKYTIAEDKKSWTKCAHHAGTHLGRGPIRNAGEFLFMVGFC